MPAEQAELVQSYINTREYLTIKIYDCYLLIHRNIIQNSHNRELGLELPPAIVKRIFGSNPLSVIDVTTTRHVDPSLYDIIIFANKSAVYTRTKLTVEKTRGFKKLPYYVHEDLELLKCCGMSREEIEFFRQKLDVYGLKNKIVSNKTDAIVQKIIDYSDMSTRLNCRLVSKKWKALVDQSSAWNHVRLTKSSRYIDRALSYFQKIDIHELDLSQSSNQSLNCDINSKFSLYSLRTLCISTDHSHELLTLLFSMAPFVQYIKLLQTVRSSLTIPTDRFDEQIHAMICLCQTHLKCLQKLHIQLRSASDQIFLQSSIVSSLPITYEVIT
ncbi:unnamed protein product [Adineta ricciae]|uniref:F-box domain-containing protein n=1 Tax=Adineta ricciae TaxID=249248 RepID=A0A814J4E8_ADIRI|nr:unnamed protein product [Adineta ricciae]CAF1385514.1 unnamed protein product [Adineta ricciae]